MSGIHRWPVNSPHKGPVTRTILPLDDVIMLRVSVFIVLSRKTPASHVLCLYSQQLWRGKIELLTPGKIQGRELAMHLKNIWRKDNKISHKYLIYVYIYEVIGAKIYNICINGTLVNICVACPTPSHHLNQYWFISNWTTPNKHNRNLTTYAININQ